jgi:hypothetical protein
MPLIYNDPEHWRQRAAEARKLANDMTDAVAKRAMLEVAEKYDRVAERALERLKGAEQWRG